MDPGHEGKRVRLTSRPERAEAKKVQGEKPDGSSGAGG